MTPISIDNAEIAVARYLESKFSFIYLVRITHRAVPAITPRAKKKYTNQEVPKNIHVPTYPINVITGKNQIETRRVNSVSLRISVARIIMFISRQVKEV